jgi:coproporphyrinogen III oxidase-like Fe-S oxidoreductase
MNGHDQGPLDARTWLEGICGLLERRYPGFERWSVDEEPDGLVLALRIEGHGMRIHVRALDAGPAWITTRSFSLTLNHESEEVPEPARTFEVVLRQLLRRTDPGGLGLEAPAPAPVERKAGAREGLEDVLHRAAFIGWRSHVSHDDYPHHSALGRPTPREEIEEGWRETLEAMRDGRAPHHLGLYVHVPFCHWKCTFCMFTQTAGQGRRVISRYVDGLIEDMRSFGRVVDGTPVTSIWFGGGTPNILTAGEIERVFGTLYDGFDVPEGTQVIFEADGHSLDDDKIERLARAGRNVRLTIGVQSLDPEVQKRVGRFEKPEKIVAAIEAAHGSGIEHVNVDLMAGLPGQSLTSFQRDVLFFLEHRPDSLHVNPFMPMPWTRFANEGGRFTSEQLALADRMSEWARSRPELHVLEDQLQLTDADASVAGNNQLEDIDRRSGSLLGLGLFPLAHSFGSHYYLVGAGEFAEPLGSRRSGRTGLAVADMNQWPDAVDAYCRGDRRYVALRVDEAEERHRHLIHNLRYGLSRQAFRDIFGVEPRDVAPEGWDRLEELGVLKVDGDRVTASLPSKTDWLVYRTFLYGERVLERIEEAWGDEYDRGVDYEGRLREMLGEIT